MASEQEAIAAGEAYVKSKYPDFKKDNRKHMVRDKGITWELYYQLPPGMIGGGPVIIMDKDSLKVLDSYRTQ